MRSRLHLTICVAGIVSSMAVGVALKAGAQTISQEAASMAEALVYLNLPLKALTEIPAKNDDEHI